MVKTSTLPFDGIIIILGASGDLAQTKLIPALYGLLKQKLLDNFYWIGAALDALTISELVDQVAKQLPESDSTLWEILKQRGAYQQLDFSKKDDYETLFNLITRLEQEYKLSAQRLIYLAAPENFFCAISKNLAETKIVRRQSELVDGWQRIVYEKPFGHDYNSAHALDNCIARYFDEQQVWRIDHYLSKELVNNIAILRFANTLFEPLWCSSYVDHIIIELSETESIKQRGPYYDKYGALKDVVQNHMLQMLALVAMEKPEKLYGSWLKDAKATVLNQVHFETGVLGQYDGYQDAKGVQAGSTTETFALLKFSINNNRWRGVSFFLKTGKALDKHYVRITLVFKSLICQLENPIACKPNMLTIELFPDAGFVLQINAKKPEGLTVTPVLLDFCYPCKFGYESLQAYEKILKSVLEGDQLLSVRSDEIESAWKIIDTIYAQQLPLYKYTTGSSGPIESEELWKKV